MNIIEKLSKKLNFVFNNKAKKTLDDIVSQNNTLTSQTESVTVPTSEPDLVRDEFEKYAEKFDYEKLELKSIEVGKAPYYSQEFVDEMYEYYSNCLGGLVEFKTICTQQPSDAIISKIYDDKLANEKIHGGLLSKIFDIKRFTDISEMPLSITQNEKLTQVVEDYYEKRLNESVRTDSVRGIQNVTGVPVSTESLYKAIDKSMNEGFTQILNSMQSNFSFILMLNEIKKATKLALLKGISLDDIQSDLGKHPLYDDNFETSDVHAAYSKYLKAMRPNRIEDLLKHTKIKPKFTEEEVQKAHNSCLRCGLFDTNYEIEKLTGVKPVYLEESIQAGYEYALKGRFDVNNVSRLKYITGVNPSEKIVQDAYKHYQENKHYQEMVKIQQITKVDPNLGLNRYEIQKEYVNLIQRNDFNQISSLIKLTQVEPSNVLMKRAHADIELSKNSERYFPDARQRLEQATGVAIDYEVVRECSNKTRDEIYSP
ncbi:MAG: hypothetical protein PF569_04055 [Candidatus Woesearchaeota archaeon]|nr:hypothetical protein [Candidatus Woesearchaeota archaeon]